MGRIIHFLHGEDSDDPRVQEAICTYLREDSDVEEVKCDDPGIIGANSKIGFPPIIPRLKKWLKEQGWKVEID